MKVLVLSLLLTFSAYAGEGQGVGNGGDVIVCYSQDRIEKVEFVDLYEAKQLYGIEPLLGSSELPYLEKISRLVTHHSNYFPNLMSELQKHAQNFEKLSIYVDSDLEDIPDTGEIIVPNFCEIKQVIVRSKTLPVAGKLYVIDRRIWDRMDENSKAAAVMHEFFYGRGVDLHAHQNSRYSRYLNENFMGKGPTRGLYGLANLFNSTSQSFNEYWGCHLSSDCSKPVIINKEEFSITTTLKTDLTIKTKTFGMTPLTTGDLKLKYSGEFPELIDGILAEYQVIKKGFVSLSFKGHYYIDYYNRINLAEGEFQDEIIKSKFGSVELSDNCNSKSNKLFLEEDNFYIDANRQCTVKVEHRLFDLKLDIPWLSSLTISNDNYSIRSSVSSELVSIDWKYGKWETNEIYLETRNNDKLTAEGGENVIGVLPELSVAGINMKDAQFRNITIDSISKNTISDMTLGFTPISLNLNKNLTISTAGTRFWLHENSFRIFVDGKSNKEAIAVTQITGFSPEFLAPLTTVDFVKNETVSLRYANNFNSRDSFGYFKKIEKMVTNGRWELTTFNDSFHQLYEGEKHRLVIDLNSPLPKPSLQQRCLTFVENYGNKYRITLTSAGIKKFKVQEIGGKFKDNIFIESCLTETGAVFTDMRDSKNGAKNVNTSI